MSDAERISALRASAHPVRLRMLSLLTGSAMSAAEVARELDLTHANASYHLRVLLGAGELVEAGEEKIRGGVAKRYRYPHELALASLPPSQGTSPVAATSHRTPHSTPEEQAAYVRVVGGEIERRLRGQEGGWFHSDLEGWVDPETYEQARGLLLEASRLLHDGNRPPRAAGTVHVTSTTWMFRMSDDQDEEPR